MRASSFLGAALALACLAHPVSSADICFVRVNPNDEGTLYRVDPANPTPVLLLDLTGETFGMIRNPEVSRNGQWIAFSSEEDLMSTPWRSNLWITDRNGQQRYSVTHKTPGSFPPGSPTGSVEGTVYEDGYAKSGAWVYISSSASSRTADAYGRFRFDNVPAGEQYVTAYDPNILYDGEDFGFMPVTAYEGMTMQADVTLSWDWDNQQGVDDVAWTPSGQEVLFIDNAGGANRIRPDGSGLTDLVPKPAGVSEFTGIAVHPTDGRMLLMTVVWAGNENPEGIWTCDADGGNMRQIVADSYVSRKSLHWAPDGTLFGYVTQVQNQQGQYVEGVVFYTPDGVFSGGVALDQGWYAEFGGWDPAMQHICLAMFGSGNWDETTLVTVRLSDYQTVTVYGPADIRFPSWGPDASPVGEQPETTPEFVLGPAFPNPARDGVQLPILGAGADPVNVGVFDLMGRRVASVRGTSFLTWDCRDRAGMPVPPGTYLFRLLFADQTVSRTVVVLR
ncbi:MAG: T9SS type A sorting domain-containing protein [Candidatus Eisenbacteria bacterium]|nr:T9SS type A sorting domain-containing protein [Candidatus Eisenbacteria bacterium]